MIPKKSLFKVVFLITILTLLFSGYVSESTTSNSNIDSKNKENYILDNIDGSFNSHGVHRKNVGVSAVSTARVFNEYDTPITNLLVQVKITPKLKTEGASKECRKTVDLLERFDYYSKGYTDISCDFEYPDASMNSQFKYELIVYHGTEKRILDTEYSGDNAENW